MEQSTPNKKQQTAYTLIKGFVSDLNEVFETKNVPLNVYFRILKKGESKNNISKLPKYMRRHEKAFTKFLKETNITNDKIDIQGSYLIRYNDRAFIDMNFVIKNSDAETMTQVRNHLLAIKAVLGEDGTALADFEKARKPKMVIPDLASKVDTSTKEGAMIHDLVKDFQSNLSNKPLSSNPMDALALMASSGAVQKFFTSLASNELDPSNLINSTTSLLGNMMGPEAQVALNSLMKMATSTMTEQTPETDKEAIEREKAEMEKEKKEKVQEVEEVTVVAEEVD